MKTLGEAQEDRVAERSELLAEAESLADSSSRTLEARSAKPARRSARAAARARCARAADRQPAGARSRGSRRAVTELRVAAQRARREPRPAARDRGARQRAAARETGSGSSAASGRSSGDRAPPGRAGRSDRARPRSSSPRSSRPRRRRALASDEQRDAYERRPPTCASSRGRGARRAQRALGARRTRRPAAELTLRESELRLEHQVESIREQWDVDLATWKLPPLEPAERRAAGGRRRGCAAPRPKPRGGARSRISSEADGRDARDDADEDGRSTTRRRA